MASALREWQLAAAPGMGEGLGETRRTQGATGEIAVRSSKSCTLKRAWRFPSYYQLTGLCGSVLSSCCSKILNLSSAYRLRSSCPRILRMLESELSNAAVWPPLHRHMPPMGVTWRVTQGK
ncbi:hypothetical protein SKAU_G00033710 [Synaphobranchus kaupii]|uniref:Uncharacterized protein n=1 Tax=Synaphobranchus kaupii TaxID=118154 RepID=A0A9Q1GFG6_SYNKA|nr:hypothetical protein SKAU_G00033710 [Synaphobranchus kaupii]